MPSRAGSGSSASATTRRARRSSSRELQVLFERYYGSRLSDIDPIQVIREGFQLIYAMNLKLPSRFVILDKAIATLASVGQEVYPDFNVFEVAKPYARGLLADRFHPRALSKRARAEALGLASVARDMPYQVGTCSSSCGRERSRSHREPGNRRDRRPHRQGDEPHRGRVGDPGGFMGSAIVGVFATGGPHALGIHLLALVGFVLSGVFGTWLVWGILRHGRL